MRMGIALGTTPVDALRVVDPVTEEAFIFGLVDEPEVSTPRSDAALGGNWRYEVIKLSSVTPSQVPRRDFIGSQWAGRVCRAS
jgi:hypothetical protein